MLSFRNRLLLYLLFLFMGLTAAYGLSGINISWEIRNYYIDADNPHVEVFLVIDDGSKKKEFIFFSPGEALEVPESGQYRLSTWYMYTTFEYRYLIENKSIRIQKRELEYSREVRDFIQVSPGWKDIKKISIAAGKVVIPQAGETILAKDLFLRTLSLQAKKMNGDDVWALQRFLHEQGYEEVGEVDGWFGQNTEKAVKKFQNSNHLVEDGVVTEALWEVLSGLVKEQVNFFRGDYGD